MPAVFLGHGSPMNAIEDGPFRRGWAELAARLPRPRAVLCVSAHWETRGVAVTGSAAPPTIHDFGGFPRALFEVQYPAPGDPELAREVAELLGSASGVEVRVDPSRGLDHGAWAVLTAMYPDADVPIVQLSLDRGRSLAEHYELAKAFAPLRERGVLIAGSGDIVHNLGLVDFGRAGGYDWAERFDAEVTVRIEARDHETLIHPERLGRDAALSIPTAEHYVPLLYALALQREAEPVSFFNRAVTLGSISMTSVVVGA